VPVKKKVFSYFLLVALLVVATKAQGIEFVRVLFEYYDGQSCSGDRLYVTQLTNDWYAEMKEVNPVYESEMVDVAIKWFFADSDAVGWGKDDFFLEHFDIALIASKSTCTIGANRHFSFFFNEDYENTCYLSPKDTMRLGDGSGADIEILQVVASHSMTVDDGVHARTWQPTFDGLHQVHGFHGTTWDVIGLADNYERVGNDGWTSSVAGEWVNELYEDNYIDGYDNCPVAYTGRPTRLSALSILFGERYGNTGNYGDETATVFVRRFIPGCDPNAGSAL
jgi:Family of unknown function (DUF6345)